MLTPYSININFRLQELSEEEQLKIIRFVNHLASCGFDERLSMFDEIEDIYYHRKPNDNTSTTNTPTTTLLEDLEDLVDQFGREKMTEEEVLNTLESITNFYAEEK